MKIKIIFEDNNLSFYSQQDVLVKDLIRSLKNSQKFDFKNKELQLLDINQEILNNEDFIKITLPNKIKDENENEKGDIKFNNEEILLYLIPYDKSKKLKYSSTEEFNSIKIQEKSGASNLLDLIQETTNAKEKINMDPKLKTGISKDRMRLFDLLNTNFASLTSQNSQSGLNASTNINELLNILRPMIENDDDILGGHNLPRRRLVSHLHQAPVVPDENLINSLKEMGFPEDQCRRALIHSRNNISRATDLLLSDGLDYLPSEK
jgi:hypothetical protein